MQERSYTLTELELMRAALRDIIMLPRRNAWPGVTDAQLANMVEDELRTHMQNNTDPVLLIGEQNKVQTVYNAWVADIRKSDADRRAG